MIHCRRYCVLLVSMILTQSVSAQDAPPPVPKGVEVLARGPVHEAFASPTSEPMPTKPVAKKPPAPIEEIPPEEKPEGEVVWISGYWAWDDDRNDFLWVSGIWRTLPPGKQWVSGYWREVGSEWQWVPGFWTNAAKKEQEDPKVTYLPQPPATPEVAAPGQPPNPETFYVPGCWIWTGARYVWRAGYWARMQPGYVWVADHYRWTPSGYVYVPGYWDLSFKRRGILYAPVVFQPEVVTIGFTYTPAYAVRDTVVVESLFVRPTVCHYYFGDYYAPTYRRLGYESCVVYSRRRYDSIIVYETYERRDPAWIGIQINLFNDRCAGRAPRPPRTLVQQNTVVNNTTIINNNTTVVNNNLTMIAPTKQVAVTKNTNLVKLDDSTRQKARVQAAAVQEVAKQRTQMESSPQAGNPRGPRTASLSMPKTQPVKPGMTTPEKRPGTAAAIDRPRTTPPRDGVKSMSSTAQASPQPGGQRSGGPTANATAPRDAAGAGPGAGKPRTLSESITRPTNALNPSAKTGMIQPTGRWQPSASPSAATVGRSAQPAGRPAAPAQPGNATARPGQPPAARPSAPRPAPTRRPPPRNDDREKNKEKR